MAYLFASLSFGFFGSFHCLGMCGGFSTALTMGKKKFFPGILLYQLGRILVYSFAGGFIGLGAFLLGNSQAILAQKIISSLAGAFMILMGLNLLGIFPDPFSKLTSLAYKKIGFGSKVQEFLKKDSFLSWLFLGFLNGILPCGLVYAALLMSLSAPNWLTSFFTMFFFGLGTIPAMIFAPSLMKSLSPKFRLNMIKFSGILLIFFGIFTFYRGTLMKTHIHNHNMTGPMEESCDHPEMSPKKSPDDIKKSPVKLP